MGEFTNWSIKELMVLVASLGYVHDKAEQDNNELVMNDIELVMNKIQPVLEKKMQETKTFYELIETLDDVSLASEIIVQNPNVEIPEYN